MISVILTTYNDEHTIYNSINSILKQNFKNFELIIINDFSTDNTKQIILSFEDKRIIYLENHRNIGRSQSRNIGINKAKGDFIAIMDGDDISVPERLEIQLNYLQKNPKINLVASNIVIFSDNKVKGLTNFKLYTPKNFFFYLRTIGLPNVTWMARANFFKNFHYDPKMNSAEDQDLLLRSYGSSNFSLLKEPLVFVRVSKKINLKYKLNQIYNLFFVRLKYLIRHKLFYYIPLILIVYITMCLLYFLRSNNSKLITNLNSKYQNLFDKISN